MSDFANNFTKRPPITRDSQREISQRDEETFGEPVVEAEDATEIEQEELAEKFHKLTRKAQTLADAIEVASVGLVITVNKEETQVSAALRLLFPDDATHGDGSKITFKHYKLALDKIDSDNDFRDADLLSAASENRSNLQVFEDRKLAKAGTEKEEIDLLSNAFFAVQLAASAMTLFQAPIMHEISLASTLTPNPAGFVAMQGHMLQAAQSLALVGAGSEFLKEFLDRVGSLIDVDLDPGFSLGGGDGVSNIRQTTFEAFKRKQEPSAVQKIIRYAHAQIPKVLQTDERFLGWSNYIGVRNSKTEADILGETVKARLASSGSLRSGSRASLKRPLNKFVRGTVADTTNFLGNLTESVEAGIAMGRSLYDLLSGKAGDLNVLLNSIASFMSTYYGPDSICCLLRLTGVSLNANTIALFGNMVGLLNVTSSFSLTTDLNSILAKYNKSLDSFISRKIISRIEAMFKSVIKEVSRFIDSMTGSDTINIILTCPPIADLIALLKQMILRLEDLLINLVLEFAELFRLTNAKITAVGEVSFDSAIAGKLGRLLTKLADILDDCTDSPESRSRAQQLLDKVRSVSKAPVPIRLIPDGDIFEDFVTLPSFSTSSGLQFDPGVQTRIEDLNEVTASDIIDTCVGGASEDEILKLATQTNHLRSRLKELNNG